MASDKSFFGMLQKLFSTIDQTNDSLEQSKIQQQKIVEHIERLRKEIDAII